MNKSKTFCILPWNQLSVGTSGSVRICCNSVNDSSILDPTTNNPISITTKANVFEANGLQTIRQQMIDGEWPKQCHRCQKDEEHNHKSYRQLSNEQFQDTIVSMGEPTRAFHKLEYLNFDLGNKCNLACRMCGPWSSTLWQKQLKIPVTEKSWFDYETIKHQLSMVDTDIKRIYVIGGEPLIMPEFWQLIDIFIQDGSAHKISLSLNTNMTVWKDEWWEIFKQFNHVAISASIDGVGQTFEYIRWPAKSNTIYENMQDAMRNKPTNAYLGVTFTLQNLNVGNLPEMYAKYQGIHIMQNVLHHPAYMYFTNVPNSVYQRTLDADLPDDVKNILVHQQPKDDKALREMFITKMIELDQLRKQNLFDLPDFQEWK